MNMSADYHSHPAISRSMLMDIHLKKISGRRTFHARYVSKTAPRETETNAMRIGTVSHVSVLQPDKFNQLISIIPKDVLATNGARMGNKWKEYAEQQEALGKTCVKESEIADILAMREAIKADKMCKWIMSPRAICEQPIYWTDEETKLDLRCLPDFVLPLEDKLLCADLKTCADIETFEMTMARDLFMQEPHYVAGLRSVYGNDIDIVFGFVAVQKSPPYPVNLFQFTDERSEEAYGLWRAALQIVAACKQSNDWSDPSQSTGIMVNRRISWSNVA